MKDTVRKLFIPGVYLFAVLAVIGCILLTIFSINKYLTNENEFTYSVNGIIEEPSIPVQVEPTNKTSMIIRPYNTDKVSIGRSFYDYKADASSQEKAIIFYENTYIQNSGVDYISDEVFDVICVLDGKVVGVEESEVVGNIVKVEHDKDIISVYQGIDNVTLKVGDTVNQGSVIGKSGKSLVNSNYPSSLHFEVSYKGSFIDPENFYTLKLEDL